MKAASNRSYCEIATDLHYAEVGKGITRSNVYFVALGSSWCLIDAGAANCAHRIREIAQFLFGENLPPSAILLTHDHPDHAGSALELARGWECPVYVHPDEMPLAIGGLTTFAKYANPIDRWLVLPLLLAMPKRRVASILEKSSLKGVVKTFDPTEGVPGLPDWECISVPGHTPGEIAFFRRSDRVLVTGDSVVTVNLNSLLGFLFWSLGLNRLQISRPPRYSTWNWKMAQDSIKSLAVLEPRILASGHGVPVSREGIAKALGALAT